MNRYDFRSILYGFVFLAIGVGFVGNQFDWWEFSLFFRGSWVLLIIVPLVIEIIIMQGNIWTVFLVLLGIYYIVSVNNLVDSSLTASLIIGLSFIAVGIRLVFRKKIKEAPKYEYEYKFTNNED